jgi:hypothetical protein
MLFSFMLRSLNGLLLPSGGAVHDSFCGLYFGMRLTASELEDVLFEKEGKDGAGEPAERGCDTQSSDSESNQAWSILS